MCVCVCVGGGWGWGGKGWDVKCCQICQIDEYKILTFLLFICVFITQHLLIFAYFLKMPDVITTSDIR